MAKPDGKKRKKKKKNPPRKSVPHKHLLYSASVQSVDADLDFFARVYRRTRGGPFRLLREDFCGTALLACDWVGRKRDHRAWGIDLDAKTLEWGRRHNVSHLGSAADRLELIRGDVLDRAAPPVDVACALNFSYSVFKRREDLLRYFRVVRESLLPQGMFFIDAFGGTGAICEDREKRRIDASKTPDGSRVPSFTYIWEQAEFNPIDHHIRCYIHFKLRDGTRIRRAFTYDWRLWTLPELRELMLEAGFAAADVYLEGWDDEADETDGVFRRRTRFENMEGWVAYVVGTA